MGVQAEKIMEERGGRKPSHLVAYCEQHWVVENDENLQEGENCLRKIVVDGKTGAVKSRHEVELGGHFNIVAVGWGKADAEKSLCAK